ncbi:MAG: hypothetical protein AAF555_04060 [Verrucomicrobiota bacterium]
MSSLWILTWSRLRYHWLTSGMLCLCLSLTFALPVTVQSLASRYEQDLRARSLATPLLLAAPGDRIGTVIQTLYFSGSTPPALHAGQLATLRQDYQGRFLPLLLGYSARSQPLVGCELDYFDFRNLSLAQGHLPQRLGDAVLGAQAARRLQLSLGDSLISDQSSLFDLASDYPLALRIVGILDPSGTPDDQAVFADIKTLWTIAQLLHGHTEATAPEALPHLSATDESETIALDAGLLPYHEITEENLASFHLHAPDQQLPLSAILFEPASQKEATFLRARLGQSTSLQILRPSEAVDELLSIVFRFKQFLDTNFALILLVASLFTTLVILLTLRLRKPEARLLHRIGSDRGTLFQLQALELAVIAGAAFLLALLLASLAQLLAPSLTEWL